PLLINGSLNILNIIISGILIYGLFSWPGLGFVGTGLYDDILGLMRRYHLTPVITQEVGEAMTIIGLVSAGLGVSILPASFKRVQLNEMRWVPIAEEDAVSEMWLVWPKHHEQSPAARNFRIHLLNALR
ncbi:LysR substrate-binding domain-containing protein, partial [Escherichia sp. R-CC3]